VWSLPTLKSGLSSVNFLFYPSEPDLDLRAGGIILCDRHDEQTKEDLK
jgi:hypothetical protein